MRHFPCSALLFAWVGLAFSTPAAALDWQFSAGGDVRWFDWREYRNGRQLLMETGPLVAPLARLEVRAGGWFGRVDSLWGGGLARYDGHLQSGPGYEADAWEEIIETGWRLGWRTGGGEVSVGLLQRDWGRYIEGSATVSSAEERYRWRIATVGGAAMLPGSARWRVALDVGLPVDSHQKVYSRSMDDFTLEPGDGIYWRLSLPYRPQADGPLTLEPWYQEQYMEDSNVVRLTRNGVPQNLQAYQPESVRRELGLTLRWRLGGSVTE